MAIDVRPGSVFDDVHTMVGPKDFASRTCWCLSYRLPSSERRTLDGYQAAERVRSLCAEDPAPGVLAYDGETVVGWAAVHPRADTTFARSRVIPHVDDADVWSLWCIRVRPGHRGRGVSHALVDGAIAFARSYGAPILESYPVDNQGAKVEQTMAYVGTRALFEAHGFTKASDTTSVLNGFPRILMRLDLA